MSINGFTKRLNKEQYELYNIYKNCSLESHYETKGNIKLIHKMEIIINNIKFNFKLPTQYPFMAPELYIGNNRYINMLRLKLPELKSKGIKCLCCKSLTCTNNWKPSKRIIDIIDEFFYNKKLIKNIIDKRFLKSICDKFKIPLELEYYIGNFI
jgi:hypothetical protein